MRQKLLGRIGRRWTGRLAALALAAPLAGALTLGTTTAAHADTGDPGYECSVPAGYTYDTSTPPAFANCGGGPSYHVVVPKDGRSACTVPAGFSYDNSTAAAFEPGCNGNPLYHLVVPGDFISACTLPAGFTYDSFTAAVFSPGCNGNPLYHLRAPDTGFYGPQQAGLSGACTIPGGWTGTVDVRSPFAGNCIGGQSYNLTFQSFTVPLINRGGIVSVANNVYSSTVSPGDVMVIFGRQLTCGSNAEVDLQQGGNFFVLSPIYYQGLIGFTGPGQQINVQLPATLLHQTWATVTVKNCSIFDASAPYWLFIN